MLRPDWTLLSLPDGRLDLSKNICIDRYIDYRFNPNQFSDVGECYRILSEHFEIDAYNLAIGFGISDLINRVAMICHINHWSFNIIGNAWKAAQGYKDAYHLKNGQDVVYVASHNGNDGSILSIKEVDHLCNTYKWVMLDEAYSDFYPIKYNDRSNLIRFKTMTKSLPLPGIRFGWCYGNADFIFELQEIRDAHHCIGGVDDNLYRMLNEIPFHVERMLETKYILESEYEHWPTHGNYVLLDDTSDINKTIITRENRMALCDKETWYEHRPNSEN